MSERLNDFVSQNFDAARAMNVFGAVDFNALAVTQRRNVEAMLACNRVLASGVQQYWRRQAEIMRETMENASRLMRDMSQQGEQDAQERPGEAARRAVETGFGYARELSEIVVRTNADAFAVLRELLVADLNEAVDRAGHAAGQTAKGMEMAARAASAAAESAGQQAQQVANIAAEELKGRSRNQPREVKPETPIDGLGGKA